MPRWEEIGRVAGDEAALQLSIKFGGTRIYVPVVPDRQLVEAVGAEAAARLSSAWGAEQIDVPARPGKTARLKDRVRALLGQGLSCREIARQLAITERHARRVLHDDGAAR